MVILLLHPGHTSQSLLYGLSAIAVHFSFFRLQSLTSFLTISALSFTLSSSLSFSSSSLNAGVLHCFIFSLLLFSFYPMFPWTNQSPGIHSYHHLTKSDFISNSDWYLKFKLCNTQYFISLLSQFQTVLLCSFLVNDTMLLPTKPEI